jgi:hypothetical protein
MSIVDTKNWAQTMIELYREGRSDVEVRRELGVTKKQWDRYLQNQAFMEMVEWGRELAEAWWTEQSRINLQNKDFNTTLFKARMAKFYDWHEKVENKSTNNGVEADLKRLQDNLNDKLKELGYAPIESTAKEVRVIEGPKVDTGD